MAKKNEVEKEHIDEEELKHPDKKPECPPPKGILIPVGGAENKGENPEEESPNGQNKDFIKLQILNRFKDELSGKDPLIVIIPTATSLPEEMGKEYTKVFKKLGLNNIEVLDIRSRQDASKPEVLDLTRRARGFWFTGGDQLRLTALLGGTPFLYLLKERFTYERIVIGGTSAGAAAMSTPMIYEARTSTGMIKGELAITCGLEFIKDVAIDTHFVTRGRFVRISQVVATNPTQIGLGIEEDTGVVVTNGDTLEVIGNGIVVVVDGHDTTSSNIYEASDSPISIRDLRVHLLSDGDRYTINRQDNLHK